MPHTTIPAAAAPAHQTSWHISPYKKRKKTQRIYISITSLQVIAVRTKSKHKESVNFTWQHSHRPVHRFQQADPHLSHGLPHQDPVQKAAQQQDRVNIL